jgi:hypothetical protein
MAERDVAEDRIISLWVEGEEMVFRSSGPGRLYLFDGVQARYDS